MLNSIGVDFIRAVRRPLPHLRLFPTAGPNPENFLEYLGMWQESDEDWLLLEDIQMTDLDERSDPVPEGEESTEIKDES